MPSTARLFEDKDVSYLDDILFQSNGYLRILPFQDISKIPINDLIIWCNRNGVYQIPTKELIDWLSNLINNKVAIEICSGNGSIARGLGIVATDSFMQTRPDIVKFYTSLHQKPIYPPTDVVKKEALDAVSFYKPDIVIGSFVTQLYQPGITMEGSQFGVNETKMLGMVNTYINIGNAITHKNKDILKFSHQEYRFPWLISRAFQQEENVIWVWEK